MKPEPTTEKLETNSDAPLAARDPLPATRTEARRDVGALTQWQLISLKFSRHKLAVLSAYMLGVLYTIALLAEIVAPQDPNRVNTAYAYCPPQLVRVSLSDGLYVYPMKRHIDPVSLQDKYVEDRSVRLPLGFMVKGDAYKLWGLIPMDRHLLGVRGTGARNEAGASSRPPSPAPVPRLGRA